MTWLLELQGRLGIWGAVTLTSLTHGLGPGGYSHILAIRVCAAGEGMVLFGLVKGMVFKQFGLV